MDRIATKRRPRGVNFLLGGTVMAICMLGGAFMAGVLDVGIGAPAVRIDAASPSPWSALPE